MNNRTENSVRNIIFGMVTNIITMLLPFAVRTLIVRRMGIEYGGLNSLFSSILNFLSLSELGFGSTLVYMMYKPVADNDDDKICSLLNFYKKVYHMIGMVIVIVGIIITPFLPYLINGSLPNQLNLYILYYIYLCNTALSYFMFSYRSSLFVAFQRTDIQSKVMLYCYSMMSIIQIVAIIVFKNYYIYAFSNIFYTILQNISIYFLSIKYYPNIKCRGGITKEEIKPLISKTLALAGHKIGGTVISSFDSLTISSILGLAAVGIYGNYYTILAALMAFIGVYNNAMLPSIGNYLIKESRDRQYSLFINLNFAHIWVVGFSSICLLILLPDFIQIWVGNDLALGFHETVWFCLYFYFWQFRVLSCNFKDAAGLWTVDAIKPYIASLLILILNIILVKKIGISGALISTVLCMIFVFFPFETYALFKHLFKIKAVNYIKKEIKWMVIWLVIAIVSYYTCRIIQTNYIVLDLFVKGVFCLIFPNLLFFLINHKTQECTFIVERFKKVVIRK